MNAFTRKVLPLNVDSFFEFKLEMLWKRDLRCSNTHQNKECDIVENYVDV